MRDSAILVGLTLACAALAACPAALDDRCSDGACDPGGKADGGDLDGDATAPDATVPPDCVEDADASAPEAKACMDDEFAFFVDAAGGKDTNDGTKAKPLKSIGAAVTLVPTKGKRRIYICGAGPYPEHIKLTTAVNLFGGFACADWAPDAAVKPKVAPSDAGYALHIDGVAATLRVEDLGFEAIAGTASAPSSIAVFVANSPNTSFKRVELTAGKGFQGADGQQGVVGVPTAGTLNGNDGTTTKGGMAKTCACSTGGSSTGARGGDVTGLGNEIDGSQGAPVITPPLPDAVSDGLGNTQAQCNAGSAAAHRGSDAGPAMDAPSPTIGTLDSTGWHIGNGHSGESGKPGQGGGGGGSRTNAGGSNGGGGSGGCGGCGGSGGTGGDGGGASIALLLLSAPVTLTESVIQSADAGNGGSGKEGGPGGGGGASGNGSGSACDGNIGGNGGKGGAGAGGAGGISAAVLHKNGIPVNAGSTLKHGTKGAPGSGGKSPDNDGPDGLAGEIVAGP